MIRRAEVKDASRLAEILIFAKRMAYRPIFRNDAVSFNEMQVLDLALTFQQDPDALDGVHVYDDGIVKGMMRFTGGELHELYVDPFFQQQGIGHELLTRFLSDARERHAPQARLWVLEKNLAARRFYESHGFRFSGETKLQPGTTETLLRYAAW